MEYIDIRGTSQENIAKEVEEIAKRRGMELEFQVKKNLFYFLQILVQIQSFLSVNSAGHLAFP